VSTNTGVTQAWLAAGSTGANTVTLTKTQVGGLQGAVGTTATFDFTLVAGTADSATIAADGATATTGVTVADIETLSIAATGANTLGTLTAAATTTLNVSGTGSVSATAAGGTFKTVNASTNTGGLTLNVAALAATDLAVTGGSGNDVITIDFANLTKDDVINLGAGTDTLAFAVTGLSIASAADAAKFAGVAGVEALRSTGAITTTIDADLTAIAAFGINSTGASTFTNLGNADAITFGGAVIAASSYGLKLGQNTVNFTLAGSATAASDATALQTITGSSIVNVVSSGTAGVATNVLNTVTADNNTYNVTGAKDLTLTVNGAVNTTGQTVNASAFTGKLTVTGTAATDTIVGGTGADTISGGAGAVADTLTGGAGADKFIIIAGVTAATADTITDFVTKSDTISFGTAVLAANYTEGAVAGVADFAAALAAANLVLTNAGGTHQVNVQQVGADSFVFYNNGVVAGADQVVKLTGVALTGIEAADIVA
jgi:Ca2+-binding RTX toxin-like protein